MTGRRAHSSRSPRSSFGAAWAPARARRRALAAALALAALLLVSASAGARELHVGIDANTRGWGLSSGLEQDVVAETGARWIREELYWDAVEEPDDRWSWSSTDQWMSTAAERGLRVLPLLSSPPCWAVPVLTPTDECDATYPVSDAEYAEFVAQVVARYGPGGSFWRANPQLDGELAPRWFELWNEPYLPFTTGGRIDPARYARLYRAAAAAGRAANPAARFLISSTVDVVESTTSRQVNWAASVVEAVPEIGRYVDGIAIHPYPADEHPDVPATDGTENSFKNTDRIWRDWVREGIRRPVWITEVGYSSCDDGADECLPGATQQEREERKAELLSVLFDQLGSDDYPYVDAVFLYRLRQWADARSPNADKESWFGILDGHGERLPAWQAFADAVAAYDDTPAPERMADRRGLD